jgi:hypothetical protein
MTNPTPPAVQVQVAASVVKGPDNQPWVRLEMHCGFTAAILVVPEATADELAAILAKQLSTAAAAARRLKLGLIVPDGPAPLILPTPPNGGRP